MLRPPHAHRDLPPVAREILAATAELLDQHSPESITAEMVAQAAAVDPVAIEVNFDDVQRLVRHARVLRFTRYVDESISTITMVMQECSTREELREWLHRISASTQARARSERRLERAGIFGAVAHDEELHQLLAAEQKRLTDSLVELIVGGQGRKWISIDIDPYAVAVLVQAYTLGRVVDDVTGQQMDPEAWLALIRRIVDNVLIAPDD